MVRKSSILLLIFSGAASASAADGSPLARRYQEGDVLKYHYSGTHAVDGRINHTWSADAASLAKKDSSGTFHEEIQWTNVMEEGKEVKLPPVSVSFRQSLSLEPSVPAGIPNLEKIDPALYAPIMDLLNFYVDELLAIKQAGIRKAGDHAYYKYGKESSWADGTRLKEGYDCIDFDITLAEMSKDGKSATLKVRHVPPPKGCERVPAEWMRKPVADTANNWFQVENRADGGYDAEAGKEVFDVDIKVKLPSGIIESATMYNPVEIEGRTCKDAELADCGAAKKEEIVRRIKLTLEP